MNTYKIIGLGLLLGLTAGTLSSCNKYLDENPRSTLVEPDNAYTIKKLLVAAYPTATAEYLTELASDNIQDDGTSNPYTNQFVEGAAYWTRIINSDGNYDAVYKLWLENYYSLAHVNLALDKLAKQPNADSDPNLLGIRGEALVLRAWIHFELANTFCLAYDPKTASSDLGIPYVKQVVRDLQPDYPRGTLAETYQQIEADLKEGIPLVERYTSYSDKLRKYHFDAASAHALAARFYLYYQKWAEAEEHATEVLGENAAASLRNWQDFYNVPRSDTGYANAYYEPTDRANLLSQATYTYYLWLLTNGASYYNTRFTQSQELTRTETLYANNIWGNDDPYWFAPFIYTEGFVNKTVQPKQPVFPGSSATTIITPFTTDETLMVRAEARIHQQKYDAAIADLNLWTTAYLNNGNDAANPRKKSYTKEEIIAHYTALPWDSEKEASMRKPFQPHFTIASDDENALLQHLLQCRRILTMHEGLRWQDIKRFGITIYRRQSDGSGNYSVVATLPGNDPRQAIQLPGQAVKGSIQPNPRPNINN